MTSAPPQMVETGRHSSSGTEPSLEEQRAFYDAWNLRTRNVDFDDVSPTVRRQGSIVVEAIRSFASHRPRILEVGCGTGWLTGRLCEVGDVTGIDLSSAAIGVARGRRTGAELIVGDFCTCDLVDRQFDVGVAVETLFYVTDQARFVARLAQLVRPGGLLAVTTISKFVYDRWTEVPAAEPGQVRKWLGRNDLKRLLSRDFEVQSVISVEPRGDRGLLHLANSYKLNALLERLWSRDRIKTAKERLGLGSGLVVLARRRA